MSSVSAELGAVDALAAWTALLDTFEASIRAVHAGEPVGDERWMRPDDLPPLPVELADRAREVARRQAEALTAALDERRTVAKHLAAVASIPGQRRQSGAPAVYIDRIG